jgi:hypothetical protein
VFNKNVTAWHAPVISKPRQSAHYLFGSGRVRATNLLHPSGYPPKMREVAPRSKEFRDGRANLPSATAPVSNLVRAAPYQPALPPLIRWSETP